MMGITYIYILRRLARGRDPSCTIVVVVVVGGAPVGEAVGVECGEKEWSCLQAQKERFLGPDWAWASG